MSHHLLMAAAGGGGTLTLTEQGRWLRQGVIIAPDVTWEGTACLEPNVLIEGTTARIWYRAGSTGHLCIGYATASMADLLASPTTAVTKYASNPILGDGNGGYTNDLYTPFVTKVSTTYYLYATDVDAAAHKVFTSSTGNPGSWSVVGTTMSLPTNCTQWGNTFAWNEGGTTWKMLVEAYNSVRAEYDIYAATSSNGTTWTLANSGNPLTTFRQASNTGAGGAEMHQIDGLYQVWYQANATHPSGPSDIYRAYSSVAGTDAWTQVTPKPILSPDNSDAYEIDQVADPCIVEYGGYSLMFYDAVHRITPEVAAIKLATFGGSLSQLVGGR